MSNLFSQPKIIQHFLHFLHQGKWLGPGAVRECARGGG